MNKAGKKREKKMIEHGSKSRAGVVLSSLFRSVGAEVTELILMKVPNLDNGKMEPRLVSKAEAIVRDCFEKALPKKSMTVERDEETNELVEVEHKPDPKIALEYRKMIFDRLGGKAGSESKEDDHDSVPKRVAQLNKDRLNKMALAGAKVDKKKVKVKSKVPKVPVRERG